MGGGDMPSPGKGFRGIRLILALHAREEPDEPFRVAFTIVDAIDQDVFEGDHPPVGEGEPSAGRHQFLQRIGPVDGHERASGFIIGGVEGDGQVQRHVLAKAVDGGHKPRGGKRDPAVGEVESLLVHQVADGLDHGVVVGQRLSHAHEDDIGEPIGLSHGAFDENDLLQDFRGGQVSREPALSP